MRSDSIKLRAEWCESVLLTLNVLRMNAVMESPPALDLPPPPSLLSSSESARLRLRDVIVSRAVYEWGRGQHSRGRTATSTHGYSHGADTQMDDSTQDKHYSIDEAERASMSASERKVSDEVSEEEAEGAGVWKERCCSCC